MYTMFSKYMDVLNELYKLNVYNVYSLYVDVLNKLYILNVYNVLYNLLPVHVCENTLIKVGTVSCYKTLNQIYKHLIFLF